MRLRTWSNRSPLRRAALTTAAALALVAGCASSSGSPAAGPASSSPAGSNPTSGTGAPGAPGAPGSTTTTLDPAPPPEQYSGSLDEFYRVPDPLPPGAPGDLIRVMPIATDATSTSIRVMYHSRDARDRDRAVTGVITYPSAAAPDGGWPVVAWAHGTTGLTSICAPSRAMNAAPAFGVEGVRVATDYIGLGPLGERHAYLSGASEAHSVIDAVRAARRLPDAHASARWLAIGHSQGGHSALWTNELGESYGPELDLLGTIVVAPAAVLDRTFGPADQIVPRMVGIMALYGIVTDHPEIDPNDYVGPEVAAKAHVIDEKCTDDVVQELVFIPPEVFYKKNPVETEPARSVVLANDPGHVKADAPLFLVYGSADAWVVPARVDFLFDQLCQIGQVTDLLLIDGADHGSVMTKDVPAFTTWFEDRLAGKPAPNACATRP
jgi:hypothetical protein